MPSKLHKALVVLGVFPFLLFALVVLIVHIVGFLIHGVGSFICGRLTDPALDWIISVGDRARAYGKSLKSDDTAHHFSEDAGLRPVADYGRW